MQTTTAKIIFNFWYLKNLFYHIGLCFCHPEPRHCHTERSRSVKWRNKLRRRIDRRSDSNGVKAANNLHQNYLCNQLLCYTRKLLKEFMIEFGMMFYKKKFELPNLTKTKLKAEGSELSQFLGQLKMKVTNGKSHS